MAILATAAGATAAWLLAPAGSSPAASPSPTTTASAASPSVSPTPPSLRPGQIIATTAVEQLAVYDAPGGSPTLTLGKWSYYALPLTLLAIDTVDQDGQTWLEVKVPVQPNGTTGWIRASDTTLTSTALEIHIYLDEHLLELVDDGVVLLSATVAVGAPDTPTPPGLYSVTDPLDFTHNDTGTYGAFALGLSGFSEVLADFNGGPPQLAIHGTNQPGLLGQEVSNGCIRLSNEDVLVLAEHAGLGTPVWVHATRDAA